MSMFPAFAASLGSTCAWALLAAGSWAVGTLVSSLPWTPLVSGVAEATGAPTPPEKGAGRPALFTGTFVQLPLPWGPDGWVDEFNDMQAVGIDTLVIQWSAYGNQAHYPSQLFGTDWMTDTALDVIFREAAARNMKVIVGLSMDDSWWKGAFSDEDIQAEIERNRAIANELWELYGKSPAFGGWYIPHEIDDINRGDALRNRLVQFLRSLSDHLHAISPGFPVTIAPYFGRNMSVAQYERWWTYVLSRAGIDILMLQDGVGTHRVELQRDVIPRFEAMKRACQAAGVRFWSDLEIFDVIHGWPIDKEPWAAVPATLERIREQATAEAPLVEKIVVFELAHYMSRRYSAEAKRLYEEYRNYLDGK